MIIGRIPNNKPYRVSSDSVWPLRRADGSRWYDKNEKQYDLFRNDQNDRP